MIEYHNRPRPDMVVEYHKPCHASRNGWIGLVKEVQPNGRFVVDWGGYTGQVEYSPSAFYVPSHDSDPDSEPGLGYIFEVPQRTENPPRYVVAGERGGKAEVVAGYEAAVRLASARAQKSKSGQGYTVYQQLETYKRSEPPIEVIHHQ